MQITKLRLAAGQVKTLRDLSTVFGRDLIRSPVYGICIGSITLLERSGNPEPHYHFDPKTKASYNAVGLKNAGWESFCPGTILNIARDLSSEGKESIVSLAPFKKNDLAYMVAELVRMPTRTWVQRVQINGSCPNVSGHGIIAQDKDALTRLFEEIQEFTSLIDFEFKTSPNLSVRMIADTAALCARYGIKWIVSANTQSVETPRSGSGKPYLGSPNCGMGGEPLLAQNIGQLQRFHEVIRKQGTDIQLIACGGISSAEDLAKCAQAGAVEAELLTAALEYGPRVFQDMLIGEYA